MINKKFILIIIGIITIAGLILWSTIDTTSKKLPDDQESVTDRDTGETVSISPDKEVSPGAAGNDFNQLPTFGLTQLTDSLKDVEGFYTDYISVGINDFVKQRLANRYSTLTVIPKSIEVTNNKINLSVRLGQTDDIVSVIITPSLNKDSMIFRVIDKDNKYGGDFVYIPNLTDQTILYNIYYKQSYKSEADPIEIEINATMSYREASIDYIRSLGFDPGDFLITFNNYENPFK